LTDPTSVDDIEWGVTAAGGTPTHRGPRPQLLRQWACRADEFGSRLAPFRPRHAWSSGTRVELMLLARYTSRPRR